MLFKIFNYGTNGFKIEILTGDTFEFILMYNLEKSKILLLLESIVN